MDMYQGPRATLQRWLDQGGPTDVSQWPEIARALRLLLEASPSPEGADAVQAGGLVITIDMVKRGARGIAVAEAQGWPGGSTQVEIDQILARACLRAALQPGGGE